MVFSRIFRSGNDKAAIALYGSVVTQARQPAFYAAYGVPDTVDGRYEMIALHMFFVLHRLKSAGGSGELAQQLFDTMFDDMDKNLREMGAGDMGVGKRVRAMAEGLYGRMAAYEAGLAGDDTALTAALRRNVFGTVAEPGPSPASLRGLCDYLRAGVTALGATTAAELNSGSVRFPAVPRLPS
jgi:cytochrome b pre-mRNA-processing protein 3